MKTKQEIAELKAKYSSANAEKDKKRKDKKEKFWKDPITDHFKFLTKEYGENYWMVRIEGIWYSKIHKWNSQKMIYEFTGEWDSHPSETGNMNFAGCLTREALNRLNENNTNTNS